MLPIARPSFLAAMRPVFLTRWQTTAATRECYIQHLTDNHQGISLLSLNRPQSKNALGRQMLSQLQQCLTELQFSQTRVLVVHSLVSGVYCAGADLKVTNAP